MIGLVLVMGIVGDLMVEAVRNLGVIDLVKSFPHGGLKMRSLLSMILGVTGVLVEVEALQHEDPLPVVALQRREILGLQRILAKARHPLNGALSTANVRGP